MPELQVINTLNTKADDLRSQIARLERELEQTKAALSHVLATMHLFQAPTSGDEFPLQLQYGAALQTPGDRWLLH